MERDNLCYECYQFNKRNSYCDYFKKYVRVADHCDCKGFDEIIDYENQLFTSNCRNIDSLINKFLDGKI